jgi:hypothetical protein
MTWSHLILQGSQVTPEVRRPAGDSQRDSQRDSQPQFFRSESGRQNQGFGGPLANMCSLLGALIRLALRRRGVRGSAVNQPERAFRALFMESIADGVYQ